MRLCDYFECLDFVAIDSKMDVRVALFVLSIILPT